MAPTRQVGSRATKGPLCAGLRLGGGVLGVGLMLVLSKALAEEPSPPQTVDELELARWVAEVGDRVALSFLAADHTSAERLVAVQAAATLRDPEQALVPLAALAGGRDPDLAPCAASAAAFIAQDLTVDDLLRREVLFSDLAPAIAAFKKLQQRKDLRPDIALQAEQVLAHLQVFAMTRSNEKAEDK